MEIVDLVIIIILILFSLIGFKRGFFKSLIMCIGFIIILILAFILKNYLGDFLVLNLPFVSFKNIAGGASTLNIIMYQGIAYFIVLSILILIYKIVVTITGIFEKILKMTIVLGIPSKILGLIFGFIEGYVILYLILFFLNQPFVNLDIINNSNYAQKMLQDTPIISSFANKSLNVFNEIKEVIEDKNDNNKDLQIANLILKDKIISPSLMEELVKKDKIKIEGIENIINKYKESDKND